MCFLAAEPIKACSSQTLQSVWKHGRYAACNVTCFLCLSVCLCVCDCVALHGRCSFSNHLIAHNAASVLMDPDSAASVVHFPANAKHESVESFQTHSELWSLCKSTWTMRVFYVWWSIFHIKLFCWHWTSIKNSSGKELKSLHGYVSYLYWIVV